MKFRCEYLYRKGIHYCIENPMSTILWTYKPMEACHFEYLLVLTWWNISTTGFCFPLSKQVAWLVRKCSKGINASRSACRWAHLVPWARDFPAFGGWWWALQIRHPIQPNFLAIKSPQTLQNPRKRVTLYTTADYLQPLGVKLDPLQRPGYSTKFALGENIKCAESHMIIFDPLNIHEIWDICYFLKFKKSISQNLYVWCISPFEVVECEIIWSLYFHAVR